jgi:hypothetical protein
MKEESVRRSQGREEDISGVFILNIYICIYIFKKGRTDCTTIRCGISVSEQGMMMVVYGLQDN